MKSFLIALQFLTRIPIKFHDIPTREQTGKSLLAYPLVGLLIGLILAASYFLLANINDGLRSAVVLTLWVLLTGALHLDGLADSADALVGGFGDKTKTLAIMKDPYCGPVAVVALILVLLLKFSALTSFPEGGMILLILAPVIARTSVLWSFLSTPYVRSGGLGQVFIEFISRKNIGFVLILIVLCIVVFTFWLGIVLLLAAFLTGYILKNMAMKRIQGMTGDTLGAQIEVIETVVLIVGVILLAN